MHPDWYYNLLANPVATVEVGTERFQVRASSTVEPERSQLYAKMVEMMPGFAEYECNTRRTIPVLTLMRIASAQE
jgi:deazaflavin-dependent oxidoreductase (nitroreductase family)